MELTKKDTQAAKGVAVLAMVMLHLFCRTGELPYTPLVWIGDIPLVYYLGLFGDICVPIFCFCSGYAHYLLEDKDAERAYVRRIPGKLIRFLLNYWIVLIVFSLIGLAIGSTIPGSFTQFIGNALLYGMNYNGAWWFVVTYLFLLLLSPLLYQLSKRVPAVVLLGISLVIYGAGHYFRFMNVQEWSNPVLNWFWHQAVLLAVSQLPYMIGMVCRKKLWISKIRENAAFTKPFSQVSLAAKGLRVGLAVALPVAAFIGHAVMETVALAPFTAMVVLLGMFVTKLPWRIENVLCFFGAHSTNIWLVHMFFYAVLFENLVFVAKYPPLVLLLMLALCVAVSYGIRVVYDPLCNRLMKGKV